MQFLTAKTLLYVRVLFLTFLCFYLVTDPEYLGNAGFVMLLGQAMEVKYAPLQESNPIIGLVVLFLGINALTDLIPLLADNLDFFETIVPTRLTVYFALAAYSYIGNSQYFSTSVVFVYCFLEVWINFLIFNNLRDEKYVRLKAFVEENVDKIMEAEGEKVVVVED